MAEFIVTDPSGKEHIVTAPDGATQDQALEYAKSQFAAPPPSEPSIGQRLLTGAASGAKELPGLLSPIGAVVGASMEGGKMLGEGLDKLAYNAGGATTDLVSKIAPPEVAAGAGLAANVATQAVPSVLGGEAMKLLSPAFQSGAVRLMQSAIKPNKVARESGAATRAIDTMLEKGINATGSGLEETQSRARVLEQRLQSMLENSPGIVNRGKAMERLKGAFDSVRDNLNTIQNVGDINKVVETFVNHPNFAQGGNIPVAVANRMKQAFYKELSDAAYVPGASLTATSKAHKALAGGLRDQVALVEPAAVPTLKEQSDLINIIKVLGPRVSVEGNKNILGLGTLSPTAEKMLVWILDRDPWAKSMLARIMNSGSKQIPANIGRAAGAVAGQMMNNEPPSNPQH